MAAETLQSTHFAVEPLLALLPVQRQGALLDACCVGKEGVLDIAAAVGLRRPCGSNDGSGSLRCRLGL